MHDVQQVLVFLHIQFGVSPPVQLELHTLRVSWQDVSIWIRVVQVMMATSKKLGTISKMSSSKLGASAYKHSIGNTLREYAQQQVV